MLLLFCGIKWEVRVPVTFDPKVTGTFKAKVTGTQRYWHPEILSDLLLHASFILGSKEDKNYNITCENVNRAGTEL